MKFYFFIPGARCCSFSNIIQNTPRKKLHSYCGPVTGSINAIFACPQPSKAVVAVLVARGHHFVAFCSKFYGKQICKKNKTAQTAPEVLTSNLMFVRLPIFPAVTCT